MMLMKAAFLLLAAAVLQVPSENIEPRFMEDVIREQSDLQTPSIALRIVSGWEAILGQHPHQASLRMVDDHGGVRTCGGSFVHREWVISAAHCTLTCITVIVRGGMIDLTRPEYFFETTKYWNYPSYDTSPPRRVQPNDISLVKLQRPVTYTSNLQPIRLQPTADASRDYSDIVLQASGYGRIWTGGPSSEVLRWVYLRGVSNILCGLTFGTQLITQSSICAQWYNVTSQSTCQGDSGGSLVYVNSEGETILVGVTSFVAGANSGGCHSGMPAGFIRPGHFHRWFTEVSGINFENLNEEEDETTTTTTTIAPLTILSPTTFPPTTLPATTLPSSTTLSPTTPEGSNEEGSDEEEDDTSEEDEDLSQLLKRLQVKVKVKVKLNQFRKKVIKKIQ